MPAHANELQGGKYAALDSGGGGVGGGGSVKHMTKSGTQQSTWFFRGGRSVGALYLTWWLLPAYSLTVGLIGGFLYPVSNVLAPTKAVDALHCLQCALLL